MKTKTEIGSLFQAYFGGLAQQLRALAAVIEHLG